MVGIAKTACVAFKREKEKKILQPGWCLDPKDSDARQFKRALLWGMGS